MNNHHRPHFTHTHTHTFTHTLTFTHTFTLCLLFGCAFFGWSLVLWCVSVGHTCVELLEVYNIILSVIKHTHTYINTHTHTRTKTKPWGILVVAMMMMLIIIIMAIVRSSYIECTGPSRCGESPRVDLGKPKHLIRRDIFAP